LGHGASCARHDPRRHDDGAARHRPVLQNTLFIFHKNVGVLLLILVVLRLLYRWRNPPAPLPDDRAGLAASGKRPVASALYALLFIVPVAGYIRVKAGGFPSKRSIRLGVPRWWHALRCAGRDRQDDPLLRRDRDRLLIGLHVAAAALSWPRAQGRVFSRMWPPFARPKS
jgi:hypothetical protein